MKVREHGRVVNVHPLVATGVNADGHREILGLDVASAEDGSLSRFPCKPRVTNAVNLSQGESSREEDDQRVQRRFPAVGSSS